jgi:hypothetical protein
MNALISVVAVVLALVNPVRTQQPPALSSEGRAAYERLAAADMFAIGPVGIAATTSEEEKALRTLLEEPRAAEALASLVESATPVGKLYGLAGLSVKDRDRAVALSRELGARDGSTEVDQITGCIVMRVKLAEVLARIERGECAAQLERPARSLGGR